MTDDATDSYSELGGEAMDNAGDETTRWLTVAEVARELHVHPNTVRNWSRNGALTSYRLGKRRDRRFRWDDVKKLLQVQSTEKPGGLIFCGAILTAALLAGRLPDMLSAI